jgi:hypothetical protein
MLGWKLGGVIWGSAHGVLVDILFLHSMIKQDPTVADEFELQLQ